MHDENIHGEFLMGYFDFVGFVGGGFVGIF